MKDKSFTVELKCLFCDCSLEGDSEKEFVSGGICSNARIAMSLMIMTLSLMSLLKRAKSLWLITLRMKLKKC